MKFDPTPKDILLRYLLESFNDLVDEFNYARNGVDKTKDFIKYLLFEFYWQATKPEFSFISEKVKSIKKDTK